GRIEWGSRRWKRQRCRTALLQCGPATGGLHAERPLSEPGPAVCDRRVHRGRQRELPGWWRICSWLVETRLAASPETEQAPSLQVVRTLRAPRGIERPIP